MTLYSKPFIDRPSEYGNSFVRDVKPHSLVFHCTVGRRGRTGILRTILNRKADPKNSLGVDFSIWPDDEEEEGTLIHRHAPEGHYTHHVPGLLELPDDNDNGPLKSANLYSYGCECVNPADPRPGRGAGPPLKGQREIRAPWYPGGRYIQLSENQMRAAWSLCQWAFAQGVPERWPGYRGGRYHFGQLPSDKREPGVVSHVQVKSNHGDGEPQTIYCLLRSLGWGHDDAYRLVEVVSSSATKQGGRWSSEVPVPGPGQGSGSVSVLVALAVLLGLLTWRGVLRPMLVGVV